MEIVALVTWVLTALGGFVLLGTWLTRRNAPGMQPSRIGPGLIAGHAVLAAIGLVLWLVYVLADVNGVLPTVGLAILLVVAAAGFAMFGRWVSDRRSEPTPDRPEQRFPVPVVVLHGLFGALTLVFVGWVVLGA